MKRVSLIAVLVPASARAADVPVVEPYPWMHQMMWGAGWYGMIFGPLLMILVLAIVIAAAVLIVRWLGAPWYDGASPHYLPTSRTHLDILKERFARGEIDKDEFEDRRRVLGE